MKFRIPALAAVLFCCFSCVNIDYEIGSNLIPDSYKYKLVTTQSLPIDVDMEPTDSLSGYSSTRIAIGAVKDADFGITKRSCALTLIPFFQELDFGKNPKLSSFHFSSILDTVSVADKNDMYMLQTARVYALKEPLDSKYDYDCNGDISAKVDWSRTITKSNPVLSGRDSLAFDFTEAFAKPFLDITSADLKDYNTFVSKFPGIYIDVDDPVRDGGRINFFNLQLGVDTDTYIVTSNYAILSFSGEYDGARKDTCFFFYFSPDKFYDIDSLINNSSTGSFPQSCLNLNKHDHTAQSAHIGKGRAELYVEGGGGLKPHISAVEIRDKVRQMISANGDDPDKAIISKASLILQFDKPDPQSRNFFLFPGMMSPTVRMHKQDTTKGVTVSRVAFYGLTDASSSSENQGDIDRANLCYCPDITYHMQEIMDIRQYESDGKTLTDDWKDLQKGERDIWLLAMAYETVTTTTAGNDELSEYYSMLAYQSYYQSMYGGYSGYSSYGYGDSYSNYYSYMMAAQYAANSSTSTSTSLQLDNVRFYKAVLCGPSYSDATRRPVLKVAYAIPQE